VGELRARLAPVGLAPDVQDLLILSWAELHDREVRRYGGPVGQLGIGQLTADMTFRQPVLPAREEWERAVRRAESLFGVAPEPHLSAAALERLGRRVREKARSALPAVSDLEHTLHQHRDLLGLTDASPRMASARRARELVDALAAARDDLQTVQVLAAVDLPREPQALARSIATAAAVAAALKAGR